jgi:uncharacterized membrane protein
MRRSQGFALSLLFLLLLNAALANGPLQSGSVADGLVPVSLGEPTGCFFATGRMLNDGVYPDTLIVTGDALCPGFDSLPYVWQDNQWSKLELPDGGYTSGYAESVSDAPGGGPAFTVQLLNSDGWDAWVIGPGSAMSQLALLDGTSHIDKAVISADGNFVVGSNSANQQAVPRAVRWAKDGGDWLPPQDLGRGQAVATTADGSIVVGNNLGWGAGCDGGAWVWTDDGNGGSRIELTAEGQAKDITHDGSMIVGCRQKPCDPATGCATYPAPVYWSRQDGQWVQQDLEALDGVDSEAVAVAIVGGYPVILGYGFTNQQGGIMRVVVWIPEPDGTYGLPLRLEALGGNFESWSWPHDINRQGFVLGWSEVEPFGAAPPVLWSLLEQLPFQMNAGLSDAWYNPATGGQGFAIIVWENIRFVFLAWFTYDTERPDPGMRATVGEAGHRWLTAEGHYTDNRAELTVYLSEGGVFDFGDPAPVSVADGTMVIEFDNCLSGTVSYEIPSAGVMGVVPIQRITHDHVAHCETAAAEGQMRLMNALRTNR